MKEQIGTIVDELINKNDEAAREVFKQYILKKGINEASKITQYGPGDWQTDPDAWERADLIPSRKRKSHRSSVDKGIEDEPVIPTKKEEPYKSEFVGEEGKAPNGERYNMLYVIQAKNISIADYRVDMFSDVHWGAKKIVDKKVEDNFDEKYPIKVTLYVVDNHKHGHWNAWKDK